MLFANLSYQNSACNYKLEQVNSNTRSNHLTGERSAGSGEEEGDVTGDPAGAERADQVHRGEARKCHGRPLQGRTCRQGRAARYK